VHLRRFIALLFLAVVSATTHAADGNRLTYLDDSDLYYVNRTFPKLITPQWVGEDGVEAVVILAIDDMRVPKRYEDFLRPILNRLKKMDGRAPVSIMTNQVDPKDPQLQEWLKEGLSLETHTFDHPCPLLKDGDFAKAKTTYDKCVDLLAGVPNSKPVAFRMPCCDSLNTPSPRFYAEIFNKTTEKGNFLTLDSSVFNIFTSNDPQLPRELVIDTDGQDKFRKYLPADRTFVNTIENYPYPYVIGKLCWQFPCLTPSDWLAQHRQKPANPITLQDWKAALDCTVIKQGVMCLVFHPYGWCKNEQVVDLIDHAVTKHGKKVKFLTFKEAEQRLNKNLLAGQPLRRANGADNGVRLLDLDSDGFLDVVIGNEVLQQTRHWSPKAKKWIVSGFPVQIAAPADFAAGAPIHDQGVRFGILKSNGSASCIIRNGLANGVYHFEDDHWLLDKDYLNGLELDGKAIIAASKGVDMGLRLRDLAGAGRCQLIASNPKQQAIFSYSDDKKTWSTLPFALPTSALVVDDAGHDAGLRFVDIDEDGHADLVWSNENGYGIYLFKDGKEGWSRRVIEGKAGDKNALPMIVRKGENMGFWPHSRHFWWQNENTNLLKDLVDRRSFVALLGDTEPTARSPEASLKSWQPRPGFTVELAAAEPLVQSPIFVTWGPDGRMWVVEMGDYPQGLDGKYKPGGKIKYLEDTNGDGKYIKATTFLEGVNFPTSVIPWRKGVIVTAAPEIFYAEDTKGTGKADRKVPLFTGFKEGNPQHRVNSLVWGLDNWIYCANGDSGGVVKAVNTLSPNPTPIKGEAKGVNTSGRDLRIRPDTGALDLQAGQTQYGRSRDDWNNWFGNNNSWPMYHFVLSDHYQRRNPHLPTPDPRVQVSVVPGASQVYPASRTLPRFNDPHGANHFTSACSAIVYRDELFGPAFAGNSFVSEPVHDLVHREIMAPKGVTFTSQRASDELKSEFLASTDNWTRPTTIATGPDGALWVVDMYRYVIEHPEWIPKDWQAKLNLRAGENMGRIYRVFPAGAKPRQIPRLDKLGTAGLVAALDSPNGWQRDMAQMMLLWKQDKAAVPLLETMATGAERPLARVHALCTLDGLNALQPALLQKSLADAHPGVRRHAVRLCAESTGGLRPRLADAPELGAALMKMTFDADAPVRMQLAYTLGEWNDPRAGQALGQLAVQDRDDRYLLAAILSSVNKDNLGQVLVAVLKGSQKAPPPANLVENLLRMANALNHTRALLALLNAVGTPEKEKYADWQYAALAGLLDALDQRNTPLTKLSGDKEVQAALQKLSGLFTAARATLGNKQAAMPDKLVAIKLLGRGLDRQVEDLTLLADLLVPQTPDELQAGAIAALGQLRDPKVPELLLRGWKGYGPPRRAAILDTLFRRDDWLRVTLDAIEKKQILATEVDPVRRQRLLQHKAPEVGKRASKLFADAVNPDRQKVIDAYQPVIKLQGDAKRGSEVFAKSCATCHKVGNVGHDVGPDLASVGDKSPQGLLISILDPNRVVEARYVQYTAITKNGLTLNGVLTSETGTSITLMAPEGKPQVVLRTDLEELISTGKSPMPDGLEKDINQQAMADLITFIRATGPQLQRKTFEGNKPEVVKARNDGSFVLSAAEAEIYGNSIMFEKQYGNLGYWNGDNDHAIWTVEIAKAGKYAVSLDWACDAKSAGKAFLILGGASRLTGTVESTGSWDNYRSARVGEVVLPAGQQRVTFRPAGALSGDALIDLRSIRLVPLKE
jgi:putative membrane-bound dehydrogenase-like protein